MRIAASTLIILLLTPAALHADALDDLLAVYATRPHDYPASKDFARPDPSVPFRWHHFHDGAIERGSDARMLTHTDPFNPLEGEGVHVELKSQVRIGWAAKQLPGRKMALQIDVPADATQARKGIVHIRGIAGGRSFSEYLRARNLMNTASCYGPHYRWIKLDAFNPSDADIQVRVAGVPFRVAPGASTIAVRTNDAVERGYACAFNSLPIEVTGPAKDVRLVLGHVRMEQELPEVLSRRGKMLQFGASAEAKDPPVVWPGFTNVAADMKYTPERGLGWTLPRKTRANAGHSFRSMENGLLWGRCLRIDAPLRVDVPNGRYGLYIFGAPGTGYVWAKGMSAKINGAEHRLIDPRGDAEVRAMALGGEAVDYRPGICAWESLVKPAYYPPMNIVYADVADKHLLIELPATLSLHALCIFPADDKAEALKELRRLNYLLAESWDVSHPWVRGGYAEKVRYIGLHDEMLHPESIPDRLSALKLGERDFARGFVLFARGLTEPIFPDTIPTPAETAIKELAVFTPPGEHACATLGLLPLRTVEGLKATVSDLKDGKNQIAADKIDVRVSRYHQKTMQFGHHNHDYNYAEQYLVRRPKFDLHPGAARRVYFDIAVPKDTKPGVYTGQVSVSAADGKPLGTIALRCEVLPIALVAGPLFFASSLDDPRLKEYGFNTFHTSYDRAVKHGYKGYVVNLGHAGAAFQGKIVDWGNFLDQKERLAPLIEAGRQGKGPRGFFGGPAPGTHGNPKAAAISQEFFERVKKEIPRIDLLGRTAPAYYFRQNKSAFQLPHEWVVLAGPPTPDLPKAMEQTQRDGTEFWYIDGLRHCKEQAGRFTFGFWLWRSGAAGRFTTLEAALQYGGGTARESYRWEPYWTLLDVTTCNVDRALKESLSEGEVNPTRDLFLLREGINDYRYIATLKQLAHLPEQRKYLNDLRADLSLDLTVYYESRAGAYGENWYPRADNPWTTEKLTRTRRTIAEHIAALRKK